jgi:carbon-monoxide dehydrogenase iron sulfur subunit
MLTRGGDHKHVVKCDLCPDREIPACVDNCPNEALTLVTDVEEIC